MVASAVGREHGNEVVPVATLPRNQGISVSDDVVDAAALFKALSDPVRVKLLVLVRQAPEGEACFCDLADEFDMPQPSLSHHLKILVNAGILTRDRRGTWSWYSVQPEPLETLESLLRPGGPFRHDPAKSGRRPGRCD